MSIRCEDRNYEIPHTKSKVDKLKIIVSTQNRNKESAFLCESFSFFSTLIPHFAIKDLIFNNFRYMPLIHCGKFWPHILMFTNLQEKKPFTVFVLICVLEMKS